MLILGIESSCDETAFAVVRDGKEVLSSLVSSQTTVHAHFGGVVPEVAARQHLKSLYPLYREAMKQADVTIDQIDAIAITQGPGLIGALLVGVAFAKGLAATNDIPLIPVDHVHAHVHGGLLAVEDVKYPMLALVVSGGHTNLYKMSSPTEFLLLARTIDDACGESFDKVARLLDLPYPGGPHIEKTARDGKAGVVPMPKLMEQKDRLAFSYSGLKTHVAGIVRGKNTYEKADICHAFQETALDHIVRKIKSALADHPDCQSVVIAGGVAANQRFRELTKDLSVPVEFPALKYCADNAAMIAAYGFHVYEQAEDKTTFRDFRWDAYPRYDYLAVMPE